MRKSFILLLIFHLFSIPIFALNFNQILTKLDSVNSYRTSKYEADMTIINNKRQKTNMKLIVYTQKVKDIDYQLMRFIYPPRLKGTAILSIDDRIWYYNNRTNRVRLLSKSAKRGSMMGSSFSYEDMSNNYQDDFTGKILKESKSEYILKLIPKKDKKFSYQKVFIDKKTFIPTKIEYFNNVGIKYKEMFSRNIKRINNKLIPLFIKMNDLESQKITIFKINDKKVFYDIKLNSEIFTQRNLKK